MQSIWLFLLDDEFMYAYVHGVVVLCGDGITRHLFPHILIYAADYPEKYVIISSYTIHFLLDYFFLVSRCLIACLRQLACCPCMRCFVKKSRIPQIGMKRDMKNRVIHMRIDNSTTHRLIESARRLIFERGYGVRSVYIQDKLDSISVMPIRVSFPFPTQPIIDVCYFRVHSLFGSSNLPSTFTPCLLRIYCTSLN